MDIGATPKCKKSTGLPPPSNVAKESNRAAAKRCRDKKNRQHEALKKKEASLKEDNARLRLEKECLRRQIHLLQEMEVDNERPVPASAPSNETGLPALSGSRNSNTNKHSSCSGATASSDRRQLLLSQRGQQGKQDSPLPLLLNATVGPAPHSNTFLRGHREGDVSINGSPLTILQAQTVAAASARQQQQQQQQSLITHSNLRIAAAVPGGPLTAFPVVSGDPAVLSLLPANVANSNSNIRSSNKRGGVPMFFYL